MSEKIISLPPKIPSPALRISVDDDGAAHYICANGVPPQDATQLVEWARELVEAWDRKQHNCDNCQLGTHYGTDGVYCNPQKKWHDEFSDSFGRDCEDFTPYPDDETTPAPDGAGETK